MIFDEWWEQRVSSLKSRYPECNYNDELNRSAKESHKLAWDAALDNAVENKTSHNNAMVPCDEGCGNKAVYHLCKKCMREDAKFYAQHQ